LHAGFGHLKKSLPGPSTGLIESNLVNGRSVQEESVLVHALPLVELTGGVLHQSQTNMISIQPNGIFII